MTSFDVFLILVIFAGLWAYRHLTIMLRENEVSQGWLKHEKRQVKPYEGISWKWPFNAH